MFVGLMGDTTTTGPWLSTRIRSRTSASKVPPTTTSDERCNSALTLEKANSPSIWFSFTHNEDYVSTINSGSISSSAVYEDSAT